MKHYSQLFDAHALFYGGIYLVLLVGIMAVVADQFLNRKSDKLLFTIAFIVFSLFSYVVSFFEILPFFPDTIKFAELVENGTHDSSSLGVRLYVLISYPLRIIAAQEIEVFLLFQSAFYFLSILLLWRGWEIHCHAMKVYPGNFQVMLLLAVTFPAAITFTLIPLREFIQVFGFSLFLYGLSRYLYQGNKKWLLVGALLTIFVRPQLVIVYPILILLAKDINKLKLLVSALVLSPLVIFIFEKVTNYHFNPGFFAYLRNTANEHYGGSGMTYGTVNWTTYWDILIDLPKLMLQFLLAPLPIMHSVNPLTMKFLMLDMLFVVVILLSASLVKFKYSKIYWVMFFCLVAIFSIWEFYIGGAVRHRFPIIMMLLPLAALYLSSKLNTLLNKNEHSA